MFNFFRKKKNQVPDKYKNLINQQEYSNFLQSCLQVLKDIGVEVLSYESGDIQYKGQNGEESHYFLDNLIRQYVQADDNNKLKEITNHFKKLQETPHAYNYLFKDFEYAKQYLKVLIKPKDIAPKVDDFITRCDYPELLTMLVLDFEERFHFIRKDEVIEWDVNDNDLFDIAIQNISQESIDIRKHSFDKKFDVYLLLSGDFSASYSLLINSHLEFTVGKYGSLIGLPTKGTTFIHPISTNDFMDLTTSLYHEMEHFYNEDPGNISLDFYWFNKKEFQRFDKTWNGDGSITISMPVELKKLINNK
jgi:hypothetical protein